VSIRLHGDVYIDDIDDMKLENSVLEVRPWVRFQLRDSPPCMIVDYHSSIPFMMCASTYSNCCAVSTPTLTWFNRIHRDCF
jgi:hypothetical protein